MAETKLLFVVSNDFGELSNAMHLVRGTAFRTRCLLPSRLAALNASGLPVEVAPYTTVDDVLAAVDDLRPDAVLLFSGYLYIVNELLDMAGLERLLAGLRARRVAIATTDPFLGMLEKLDERTFDHPRRAFLMDHFGTLVRVFKDVPHIYLVPPPPGQSRWLSFYNPALTLTAETRAAARREVVRGLPVGDRPRWVFVLANEDWGLQTARFGAARFAELLRARLVDTVRAGRQPVVIGPERLLNEVRVGVEGLVALPFCAFDLFHALLIDAEHAFYWNVFSNSFPLRGANALPVSFFDRGHLAHAVPALYREGVHQYFAGWEPPCLDIATPLDPADLERAAAAQRAGLAPAAERFHSSPPPEALVAALLAAR